MYGMIRSENPLALIFRTNHGDVGEPNFYTGGCVSLGDNIVAKRPN